MNGEDLTSSVLQRFNGALLCLRGAGITRDNPFQPNGIWSVNSKTHYYRLTLSHGPSLFHSFMVGRVNVSIILQWRRGCSVVYCLGWGSSPAGGNTATPGPAP